jgi:hypothetical protein
VPEGGRLRVEQGRDPLLPLRSKLAARRHLEALMAYLVWTVCLGLITFNIGDALMARRPGAEFKGKLTQPLLWLGRRRSLVVEPFRRPWLYFTRQLVYGIGQSLVTGMFIHSDYGQTVCFWLAVLVLYVDDYLCADPPWRRWRDSVGNKVKWLMDLPKPTLAPKPRVAG